MVVCLAIGEKVNTVQPIKICGIDDIDMLITELVPDDPLLKPYVESGLKIL
jgi:DeoR/GlpR family transcriptional regulator of sugar metabolism